MTKAVPGNSEPEEPDLSHVFVIPCLVFAEQKHISQARQRNYIDVDHDRAQVVDVYCFHCHRPYAEVKDAPCAARIDNRHLRGGPADGARKKRKIYPTRGRAPGEATG